jgi:hypothetical protein
MVVGQTAALVLQVQLIHEYNTPWAGWGALNQGQREGLSWGGSSSRYVDELEAHHPSNASSSEAASDQVEVGGSPDRLGATCHAQLAEDAVEVSFDRADGDDQLAGDRTIRMTGDDEAQHG